LNRGTGEVVEVEKEEFASMVPRVITNVKIAYMLNTPMHRVRIRGTLIILVSMAPK
jgi:hypothetical protein